MMDASARDEAGSHILDRNVVATRTARIVAAYVSHNRVTTITVIHGALSGLGHALASRDPGQFRRLALRYERRADIHMAFTKLACATICIRQIRRFCP